MKYLYKFVPVLFVFLSTSIVYAQTKTKQFIQINGTVDILGNIKLSTIEQYKEQQKDSARIDLTVINKILNKSTNAIEAINLLSKEGWILTAAIPIVKDEKDRPNSPFIAYYFGKE